MSATLKSKDSSECRSTEEGIDPLNVQSKGFHVANNILRRVKKKTQDEDGKYTTESSQNTAMPDQPQRCCTPLSIGLQADWGRGSNSSCERQGDLQVELNPSAEVVPRNYGTVMLADFQ
jgi:hypothetical protein